MVVLAWGGICSVWAFLMLAQRQIRRRGLILKPDRVPTRNEQPHRNDWPTACIVIPARNEGANLTKCLRSVLAQDYPALSAVVVDDRSEDDTAEMADELARTDSRLRVERVTELPPGWLGKSHALWFATRKVDTSWLLFLDADCTLHPATVRTVVAEAQRRNVELLTLWPRNASQGFWEHVTIPLCAGIVALWFGSQRVSDPASKRAFANGQFLLIQRQAYERIDGHRSVRTALIEDIPLAERAKRAGVACWVASGRDLVAVRMYDSYMAIRDGWARIYVGALRSGTKIALSLLWLLLGSLLPYAAAIILSFSVAHAWIDGRALDTETVILSALCLQHLTLLVVVSYRFWGLGHCRRAYLWLYPLSVFVVMGILLRAWWWLTVRRSVAWRGTRYAIDRSARIVC